MQQPGMAGEMYKKFFNMKERPFQLTPNPEYLYMSRIHEEAMAHLTYALSQGDGFVEITGEVGTGKTTLCRSFLENLDETRDVVAYIFNPKLDEVDLLKSINDEFGVPSAYDNPKALIDALNRFLMDQKSRGKKVVLVIDEAQNLSKPVLEQLRLLSNLETTKSKLLQIILIGQPELSQMLDSYELRQLGQRITLSYHLKPLRFQETRSYIEHRISIASAKPTAKFTKSAIRAIHRFSGGTPRLINIAADRCLLTAWGVNKTTITGAIAKDALGELSARGDRKDAEKTIWKPIAILSMCISFVLLAGMGVLLYNYPHKNPAEAAEQVAPALEQKTFIPELQPQKKEQTRLLPEEAETTENTVLPAPAGSPEESEPPRQHLVQKENPGLTLDEALRKLSTRSSRLQAFAAVMNLWNHPFYSGKYLAHATDEEAFFSLAAQTNGFSMERIEGDINSVIRLNLPAVLMFYSPDEAHPVYLALKRVENNTVHLAGENDIEIETNLSELSFYWSKLAYIPWKNYLGFEGVLPRESTGESILALKNLLQDIGFRDIEMGPEYDDFTRTAVETVQERNGIPVDGMVGPITRIILYNELKTHEIPHLTGDQV